MTDLGAGVGSVFFSSSISSWNQVFLKEDEVLMHVHNSQLGGANSSSSNMQGKSILTLQNIF